MTTAQIKTDNSFARDKIDLRVGHLPEGRLYVLDCYAGTGKIWRAVKAVSGREMTVLPIDVRGDVDAFHLHGDNLSFLRSLNLKRYNVIDLDAYGVPFDQLEVLFEKRFVGTVFVTFIQSAMGRLPDGLLKSVGFTEEMIGRAPTLLCRRGWEYFKQYLGSRGVAEFAHRSVGRKHYLAFALER